MHLELGNGFAGGALVFSLLVVPPPPPLLLEDAGRRDMLELMLVVGGLRDLSPDV